MPIMKKTFLAYFFALLFISIVALPSILVMVKVDTETVLVLDKGEEESKENESHKKLNLTVYSSNFYCYLEYLIVALKESVYLTNLHLNLKLELQSPPPELI